ncbi:hypothetical protein [Benzoatithermus flavus]|uniref:Uncharacterized protein n=1 Tax=Benzoatithermus flavus TaxID=3108223 RepID=A0ABU8Y158_9PROT
MLGRALAAVAERRSGGGIVRLDVLELADRPLADPAAGFRDIVDPCLGAPCCDGAPFWDRLHPVTAAHAHRVAAASTALGRCSDDRSLQGAWR